MSHIRPIRTGKRAFRAGLRLAAVGLCAVPLGLLAADWPQWRGASRDGKAAGFSAPQAWPQALSQTWRVTVGRGDASPALVGDRLYVFVRDDVGEVTVCLEAGTGKEVWRDRYESAAAAEPMGKHPGPRSSPAVADGKVVTYGARGSLSCLEAATGKVLWRKDEFAGTWPQFFTASSPLIVDGLCVAQLGGENKGGMVACDMATGEPKWKWTDDGTAYASPTLMTVEGTRLVVTLTAKKVVGITLADGKLQWELPFPPQTRAYNTATPIVDGQTVIYAGAGRGTQAVTVAKAAAGFAAKALWGNPDNGVQFNSPVLRAGQVYGLSQAGVLFCLEAQGGKTLWTTTLGGGGFGSLVDAGPVLMALTPQGELVVFEPSDKEFKKLAGYAVGTDTYAHPVVAAKGVYVKDKDAIAFWSLE